MQAGYAKYLGSPHWTERGRAFRLTVTGCRICGQKRGIQIHHLTYEHMWNEPDSDLIALCGRCHQDVHDFHRVNPSLTLRRATFAYRDLHQKRRRDIQTWRGLNKRQRRELIHPREPKTHNWAERLGLPEGQTKIRIQVATSTRNAGVTGTSEGAATG